MTENELLRRFVEQNAQEAFAELVRGKINLVYAAALRLVGGDSHLAEDVTQGVFVALACQAAKLKDHAVLTGWLYTTTRFVASKMVRGQKRWQRREMEAHEMNTNPENELAWQEVRPVIDDALHELGENERALLLLRFFENRTLAEVGVAVGVSENAARMRVDRSLEKLRGRLAQRGIKSTAAALGAALAGQTVVAAPANLASSVTSVALNCAAAGVVVAGAGGTAAAILNFMSTIKTVLSTAGAIVVFGVGAFVGNRMSSPAAEQPDGNKSELRKSVTRLTEENRLLKAQLEKTLTTKTAASASLAGGAGVADAGAGKKKWEFLIELSKQKFFNSQLNIVDGGGALNPAVAAVFDLTPEEERGLTRAFVEARGRVEALERANATVTRTPDGKFVIAVKPFPTEGGAVYDELMATVAKTIGPDRNAAFQTLGGDQIEKAMGSFGASERKVTVTSQPDSKSSRYRATDERTAPGSRINNSRNYRSKEELAADVGTLMKMLPADF